MAVSRPSSLTVPRVLAALLLSVVFATGLAPLDAHAHSGKQSYLYVSIWDDGVEGRVEMPAANLGNALGVDIARNTQAARAAVGEMTGSIIEYVSDNLALSDDTGRWTVEFGTTLTILPTENGPYVVLPFVVDEVFSEPPTSFTADFSVIIEADPDKDALLIIEDDWATATFRNGSEPLLGFSVDRTAQRVELDGASTIDSMAAIRGIGTDAVRNSIDLMLIVVAVAVPALMVPAARRMHVVAAGTIARRVGNGFAALVAGHTMTMWLVGTGVFSPPERLVGVAVAIGLCAMGGFGLVTWRQPNRWSFASPIIVTVGLLQGLGLGTYFTAQDLDRRRPVVSMIAFQLGVEIAVVILVLLIAAPLLLLRRTRVASLVTVGLSIALFGYGIAWIGERLADADWPIEEVSNPLRVWPRNLAFVALAVAVAAGLRRLDERSGDLRPIDNTQPTDDGVLRRDQETVPA